MSVEVMVMWPDGRVVGTLRWRMDKMDVVRDEDNAFFLSSSTAPDPSNRAGPSAQRSSLNTAEGYARLLRAALLYQGVEEVGDGGRGMDR